MSFLKQKTPASARVFFRISFLFTVYDANLIGSLNKFITLSVIFSVLLFTLICSQNQSPLFLTTVIGFAPIFSDLEGRDFFI
jgi:hypothetical protein